MVGRVTGLTTAVTGLGGALGAGFGLKKAIAEAADMETLLASFTTMLHGAQLARGMMGDLQKLANNTPLSLPEVAQAGATLLGMGAKANNVTSELKMLGDIAKTVNMPLNEMAAIYGKMRSGGSLHADDINQLASHGIPVLQQFAAQFGVGEEAVRGLVEHGKIGFNDLNQAFVRLTSEGGLYFRAMERQATTLHGRVSTLGDSWDELFRKFGAPVNNALKPLIVETTSMLDGLTGKADEWGKTLAVAIRTATALFKGGGLGDFVAVSFELGAKKAVNVLIGGIGEAFVWAVGKIVPLLKSVFATLMDVNMWSGIFGLASDMLVGAGDEIAKSIRSALPSKFYSASDKPDDFAVLRHKEDRASKHNDATDALHTASETFSGALGGWMESMGQKFKVFSEGDIGALQARKDALLNDAKASMPQGTMLQRLFAAFPSVQRYGENLMNLQRGSPLVAVAKAMDAPIFHAQDRLSQVGGHIGGGYNLDTSSQKEQVGQMKRTAVACEKLVRFLDPKNGRGLKF